MDIKDPLKVYTAATNLEAHMIVERLQSNGIKAFAEEDESGVSLWAFGTISQFHKPNVWIEKAAAPQAKELINEFEERKRQRAQPKGGESVIQVECEECGRKTTFPESLDGTVQECSHCHAYVDVGELDWDEDFGEPED